MVSDKYAAMTKAELLNEIKLIGIPGCSGKDKGQLHSILCDYMNETVDSLRTWCNVNGKGAKSNMKKVDLFVLKYVTPAGAWSGSARPASSATSSKSTTASKSTTTKSTAPKTAASSKEATSKKKASP
jgi:hypothetical protein